MSTFVQDKVVVVTGAGSGIGRDIARAFAAHGASVVVNDLGKDKETGQPTAQQVAEEIRRDGGTAVAAVESVSEWAAAHRIVQATLDNFGRIDCVVNNAGIVRDRFIFNMSEEEWRAVVDVHLNGSFFMTRAAAQHFKSQQGGSYVHMTSSSGLFGNLGQANYAAAKLGIVALSKSIALDMAKFGVRSNCIAPWAWTAMTATIPADTAENLVRIDKLKKMESAKIAPLAVYLASEQAGHVSGQIFGARGNELYLFNQIGIARSMHRGEGWTPQTIADHGMPAFEASFARNAPSMAYTPWDPV
ncbi:MAG: 3-hydroxyacyl-CoA dehydrogenase [Ramlibacter sp.]|nr:3-hydroxyacyl-CoA dehydrogenase [Ramlibacter sp.]MDF2463248.1 3-hydroxyacyl-CoA dehydrogenase [Ramlibacter sp.]